MADLIFPTQSDNSDDDALDDGAGLITTPMSSEEGIPFDLIELLFFAYRDFTRDPDEILQEFEFGRAHHRVLHFVNRNPGIRVADLLDILQITKQSLGRVLKQLVDKGYIIQKQGPTDRRQRLLYPTEEGRSLALALLRPQSERIAKALLDASPGERQVIERFLMSMINGEQQGDVRSFVKTGQPVSEIETK
ncbi:MarR family winged helix-turn-helix transcriptional regulator [Coralliovum pocilloporae]|uniref:MarR family winged helix-turn-helix transcriptional regulator n=1 Tax=Coralliovum pocilloporae TaxID=3066369 RepID=UPI003D9C3966